MDDDIKSTLHKEHNRSRSILFLLVGLCLLAAAAVAISIVSINSNKTETKNNTALTANTNPVDPANYVISGDYDGGQAALDSQLVNADDAAAVAKIYINKSSLALNLSRYDDAYIFARKAEELLPSVSSAKLMASALAKQGNKDGAIEQYKIAISRITGSSELDELDKLGIQKKIDNL